jgi:pyridoxamine 5'-phosphate oxidase
MNLADIRREYAHETLDESQVDRDPLRQFEGWMQEALRAELPEPTAMHLATVGADGRPSGRIVLLKGVDADGFVFYTNYESRKGRELAANPAAALTFLWKELERQVRIEGIVGTVSAAESDAYFSSRPVASRIGAWASPQSHPIESRGWLVGSIAKATLAHGHAPTRPPHWGGYRLVPDRLEFWQGRQSRLHDRVHYAREAEGWRIRRLAP